MNEYTLVNIVTIFVVMKFICYYYLCITHNTYYCKSIHNIILFVIYIRGFKKCNLIMHIK